MAQADPELSLITSAIETRPELLLLLDGPEPVTAFLPTNTAIAGIPEWAAIVADDVAFGEFLRGHLVSGGFTSVDVLGAVELTALSGETLVIDRLAGTVNGANFVTVDVAAVNGFLHTMGAPLVSVEVPTEPTGAPEPSAAEAPSSTTAS